MKTNSKISAYILRGSTTALLSSCVLVALCSAIHLPEQPRKALPLQDNSVFGANAHQSRSLSFADRVAYQRAIEDVYWRHRIWPKKRPDPKPSLDEVMSQEQIEQKVEVYLRNSQLLADQWQRPITPQQLQAEMDRMAKNTKQSEVLRELFEALGNDPFIIAECLARPALAERLLTSWYSYDQRIHGQLKQQAEAELQTHPAVGEMKQLSGKYREIDVIRRDSAEHRRNPGPEHSLELKSGDWDENVQNLAAMFDQPSVMKAFRVRGHVAAFESTDLSAHSKNAAEAYENIPVRRLSALEEDETRYYAIAVIEKTTNKLKLAIVSWFKEPLEVWLSKVENQLPPALTAPTAGYDFPTISDAAGCIDDTWTGISGPPDGREGHTAVWTGSEMIIWGGEIYPIMVFNTGGRYNPTTDSWAATNTNNTPNARTNHTAVWTGSEMIVWGGRDENFSGVNTGGRYNPGTDNWTPTTTTNAPEPRDSHTAVWTGSEMIAWGGVGQLDYLNSGGRYNPTTDTWTATSTVNAPSGRFHHTAVLIDSEMIVWGGFDGSNELNTGGRYNPDTDTWAATSTTNAPDARELHTAVSTGNEMIVWGGGFGSGLNTGGRYNPNTDNWTATSIVNVPDGRYEHKAVWTGTEMIIWGGIADNAATNTGGRYNPSTKRLVGHNPHQCTLPTMVAHRSVDWKRDDHLGRRFWWQHWRTIRSQRR